MKCRVCDNSELIPTLDLGLQPWANHFLTREQVGQEPKYPLYLVFCTKCSCVQLNYTVPKEVMFADHTYVSGTTKTLSDHFGAIANLVDTKFMQGRPQKAVLDIGSNDGTQLKHYQRIGYSALGVESCKRIAELAVKEGVPTRADFFNREVAVSLQQKFDVINASGVFFHLEELHSAASGIKETLQADGVFVIQFLYMKSIVENLAFDQIYHEHLLYYTLKTVEVLLNRHGLSSFDGFLSPIHGGSMILFVSHSERNLERSAELEKLQQEEDQAGTNTIESYLRFAERVAKMKADTIEFLQRRKSEGKTIFGFGAPVKGNTFLNYCEIGTQFLDCLVEKNALRRGLYSPGMHIPLVIEDQLSTQPDTYLVLAWNFKREILKNNAHLLSQGVEFYFPVNPPEDA